MIISEKQIMRLINITNEITERCDYATAKEWQDAKDLITEIENQQSEELKVIEW